MKRLLVLALALSGCDNSGAAAPKSELTVAVMPKSKGNAYFIACKKGAE